MWTKGCINMFIYDTLHHTAMALTFTHSLVSPNSPQTPRLRQEEKTGGKSWFLRSARLGSSQTCFHGFHQGLLSHSNHPRFTLIPWEGKTLHSQTQASSESLVLPQAILGVRWAHLAVMSPVDITAFNISHPVTFWAFWMTTILSLQNGELGPFQHGWVTIRDQSQPLRSVLWVEHGLWES